MNHVHRSWRRGAAVLTAGLALAGAAAGPAGASTAGPAAASTGAIRPFPVVHVGASWGDNGHGQLGNDTETYTTAVTAVAQLQNLQQVSVGNTHTLGLTSDGSVWAWGYNGSGELGTGNEINWETPRLVAGLSGVTQVAAGWDHSLALRSDGTVWAWGDNTAGELGDGTTTQRSAPVQVAGLAGVTQIAAGNEWSLALKSDGTVWGWGGNQWGQLGVAEPSAFTAPRQIPGLARVTSIAAGAFFGLAIERRNLLSLQNEVLAWGQDVLGTLGNGTACLCGYVTPAVVAGIGAPQLSGLAAGQETALVLGADGSVWGWGANSQGELRAGRAGSDTRPVQVLSPGSGVTQLAAGAGHVLALLSNGTVEAWGADQYGQLGSGAVAAQNQAPAVVPGLGSVSQLSAGGNASVVVRSQISVGKL
jgi:alpha-tubulin suppressor-like RCC1 family protein